MVIFGPVEVGSRNNHGGDGPGELTGFFELGFGFLRGFFLFAGGEEDGAPVLGTNVGALPVQHGGVVVFPKNVEELGVGDVGRVVGDADGFGVAGAVGADVPVGWVLRGATGVADFGDEDTFGLPEGFFHAPEATGGEDGGLRGSEFQRNGVEAVPKTGRFRAIVEDVAEMGVAPGAKHLGAFHAVAAVGHFGDVIGFHRFQKTRPAGAGVKFGAGAEQR